MTQMNGMGLYNKMKLICRICQTLCSSEHNHWEHYKAINPSGRAKKCMGFKFNILKIALTNKEVDDELREIIQLVSNQITAFHAEDGEKVDMYIQQCKSIGEFEAVLEDAGLSTRQTS